MRVALALAFAVLGALAAVASAYPIAIVTLEKYGNITLDLRPDAAPKTVANFIELAQSGFYTARAGATLYRYAPSFVIQGGNLLNPSNRTVPLEYKLPNDMYSIGLARGEQPNTGSSEFFINLQNNSAWLAPGGATKDGYTVFATVKAGFAVVEALTLLPEHAQTQYGGMHMFDTPPIISQVTIEM